MMSLIRTLTVKNRGKTTKIGERLALRALKSRYRSKSNTKIFAFPSCSFQR
jgi:hypothetical protein